MTCCTNSLVPLLLSCTSNANERISKGINARDLCSWVRVKLVETITSYETQATYALIKGARKLRRADGNGTLRSHEEVARLFSKYLTGHRDDSVQSQCRVSAVAFRLSVNHVLPNWVRGFINKPISPIAMSVIFSVHPPGFGLSTVERTIPRLLVSRWVTTITNVDPTVSSTGFGTRPRAHLHLAKARSFHKLMLGPCAVCRIWFHIQPRYSNHFLFLTGRGRCSHSHGSRR